MKESQFFVGTSRARLGDGIVRLATAGDLFRRPWGVAYNASEEAPVFPRASMDVRCERCRAQYVFDDDQVTPSGLTVQCTNCGHVFKVKKKELVVTVPVKPGEMDGAPLLATAVAPRPGRARASIPAVPATPPPAPPRPDPERPREWRVRQANGNIFTFREMTTLQKWIIEQKVSRDDEISLSGDQWKRLGNIAELASFFQVVEAAERSRTFVAQPAVTPLPATAIPVYGVTVQTPLYPGAQPPPGYPPPSFAGAAPAPEHRGTDATPALPLPVQEVDLGADDPGARKPRRTRRWLLVLTLLASSGAGAYAFFPQLFIPARPPPEIAVPLTIQVKPEPPPEPPPQAVPAPEPVAEPALQNPPEPIGKPAKAAPKGPKALLAQAKRALEKGDADAALEIFGRVASQDPSNADAQAGRGLCYLDLENYAPAEASFLAALRLEPGQPDALLGLAEAYRSQGKKAEAIAHYEKYLAEHPDDEDAAVARNALSELRK